MPIEEQEDKINKMEGYLMKENFPKPFKVNTTYEVGSDSSPEFVVTCGNNIRYILTIDQKIWTELKLQELYDYIKNDNTATKLKTSKDNKHTIT